MQTKLKLTGSLVLGLCLLSFTGCAALKELVVKQQPVVVRPAATNMVTVVQTNVVQQVITTTNMVTITNQHGAVITAPLVLSATNYTSMPVTNVVAVVLPEISYMSNSVAQPIQTAGSAVGFATNAAGVPFVDAGIKILLAGFGVWLAFLNKKNARKALAEAAGKEEALTKLDQAKLVGQTVVENFETLRVAALAIPDYQKIDAQVMKGVQIAQTLAGVKPQVAELVEQHTDFTKS